MTIFGAAMIALAFVYVFVNRTWHDPNQRIPMPYSLVAAVAMIGGGVAAIAFDRHATEMAVLLLFVCANAIWWTVGRSPNMRRKG